MLALMAEVDHPHVRLNFDTGNIAYYNAGRRPRRRAGEGQAPRPQRPPQGQPGRLRGLVLPGRRRRRRGRLSTRVREILDGVGFTGPYTIEIEGIGGEPEPGLEGRRRAGRRGASSTSASAAISSGSTARSRPRRIAGRALREIEATGVGRDRRGVEASDPVGRARRLDPIGPAARPGEPADEAAGVDARLAERRQLDRAVALGQAAAVGADDERDVAEAGAAASRGAGRGGSAGACSGRGRRRGSPGSRPSRRRRRRRRADTTARPATGRRRSRRRRATGSSAIGAAEQVVPGDRPGGTRNRQANGRSPRAVGVARPSGPSRCRDRSGPSSSACGAEAARAMSARVQVQG